MPVDPVIATILAEAAGEDERGMYAVASVIANRAARRKKTPVQVVNEPAQFSGRWRKDLEAFVARQPKAAVEAAQRAWARAQVEPMPGVDHYLTTDLYRDEKKRPDWSTKMGGRQEIGKHTFLNSQEAPMSPQSKRDPLLDGIRHMNRMAQAMGLSPLKAQEIAQIMAQVEPPPAITAFGKRQVSGVRLRRKLPTGEPVMSSQPSGVTPALDMGMA